MPSTFDVDTVLVELQNAVRTQLTADTWYSGIDIWTPDDVTDDGRPQAVADINQRVLQSLSAVSKGVCILVSAPALANFASNSPDLYADDLAILVRIIEAPVINRGATGTRKVASTIGIHTLRRLWHFVFLGATFVPARAGLVPSDIKTGTLVWDIVYKTKLDLVSQSIAQEE
jgi:hypothetical protein